MQTFLKICSIISLIVVSLKLAIIGNLTPGLTIFIIICGLLILIGNQTIYIIVAAVAALILFVKLNGGSTENEGILMKSILTLVLVVFGLYIMLKGLFSSTRNRK